MTEQVAVKGQQPAEEKKEKTKKEMTRFQWTWHKMQRQMVGYYMIIPFLIMFICFTVIPVLLSILLSFTSFNMLQMPKFIFLDNYLRMFLDDDLFITAFKNTLIFAVATGPTSYILSFLVAWFINELSPRMRAFVTVIFYSPSIAGSAYVVWQRGYLRLCQWLADEDGLHFITYRILLERSLCCSDSHHSFAVVESRNRIPCIYRRSAGR